MLNSHLYAAAERVNNETTTEARFVNEAKREQQRYAGT